MKLRNGCVRYLRVEVVKRLDVHRGRHRKIFLEGQRSKKKPMDEGRGREQITVERQATKEQQQERSFIRTKSRRPCRIVTPCPSWIVCRG